MRANGSIVAMSRYVMPPSKHGQKILAALHGQALPHEPITTRSVAVQMNVLSGVVTLLVMGMKVRWRQLQNYINKIYAKPGPHTQFAVFLSPYAA
jgi:hypothetical protein